MAAKTTASMKAAELNILDYVKCNVQTWKAEGEGDFDYRLFKASPAKGIMYVTPDTPYFIHGRIAVRGKDEGRYPYNYLEFIDSVFGKEPNTIEVCSRTVKPDSERTAYTVDLNPAFNPSKVTDATTLAGVESNRFSRYRADPPYNDNTAGKMYGTELPNFKEMLTAGARVCKVGALMFLLLGPTNYQHCPAGVVRVGLVYISVIPNNETRALNIYLKVAESAQSGYDQTLV